MINRKYRAASWWILWEDLIYPDKGIEDKIVKKAHAFKDAGIDTVVIFGAHCRWDYIYIWDRLHQLLKFTVDTLHGHNIKVFDHHSATVTHRPDGLEQCWNIALKNRHHVPFYPSKEMVETLCFNGCKLNDFRMRSHDTGHPCYLPAYEAEIFCMNNQKFREAYRLYLRKLISETRVDGLMCDDVIYYPAWDGCGCSYCRDKFKNQYGREFPELDDSGFWGNNESDAFKNWVEMRYNDSADFLAVVREEVGEDFPLMSCCSASAGKLLNAYGMSSQIMSKSVNHIMLEMCGEIATSGETCLQRIPDIMLHEAIASRKGFPNIGLGYPHFSDSAFLVWAFNKLVGTSSWVSTLKGRLGIPEEEIKLLPDESDIVREGYIFEQNHLDLFDGRSAAKIALYFSFETQVFYGDCEEDYVTSYRNLSRGLFKRNVQFDTVEEIPSVQDYPCLILADVSCMSEDVQDKIVEYVEKGGFIIGSGPLGLRDERGRLKESSLLSLFGIHASLQEPAREVNLDSFFKVGKWPVKRNISFACEGIYQGRAIQIDDGVEIQNNGTFSWNPVRCLDGKNVEALITKIEKNAPAPLVAMICPPGWLYRVYEKGDRIFIHALSNDFDAVYDEHYKNHMTNQFLVKNINYKTGGGEIEIAGSFTKAQLYSPDIDDVREEFSGKTGVLFDLKEVQRYFVVEMT